MAQGFVQLSVGRLRVYPTVPHGGSPGAKVVGNRVICSAVSDDSVSLVDGICTCLLC